MSLWNVLGKVGLFGSYGGAAGLLGLAGAGFDHGDVSSCSGEEDEDEWPDFEGRLVGVARCVSPAEVGRRGFMGEILRASLGNWWPEGN